MRRVILILLCLLSLATVWLYWPGRPPQAPSVKSSVVTASPAAAAAPGSQTLSAAAAAVNPATNAAATNRLTFRLTNTAKPLGQLTTTAHAILLENALMDTDVKQDLAIPKHLQADGEPGAFIVQARGVIDGAFRATLTAAGGQIVSYIPNNAYLVQLSAAAAGRLAGNPLVQAVLPYEPYFKVQSSLLRRAVEQKPLVPGTVLTLGLFAATAETTEKQLTALGAKPIGQPDHSPFGPVVRVLPPADWTALARLPGVQIMEPSRQRVNANDLSRVTVGQTPDTTSGVTNNWLGLQGENVLVAVNDSGVDATHPDLTPRVIGPDLTDPNGHGTHVAGIIASSGLNSTNVGANAQGSITNADFRGRAPMATIFSMSYGNSDYVLQTNAARAGALISNNSWAYEGDTEYDLAAASYDWATRDVLPGAPGSQAVVFVFAAGNSGGGNTDGGGGSGDTILSPGTAKNVITVGALEQLRDITNIVTTVTSAGVTNQTAFWQPRTDSSVQVADYSSRGNVGVGTEGDFGRFKPDVVAPGTFVVSLRSQTPWDTNAYFNPTNISTIPYKGQLVPTNGLAYYSVSVPPNAVAVSIVITSNRFSVPFPTNLTIYVQQSGFPDPVKAPGSIDITRQGSVSIPPDSGGAIAGIQSIQNSGFAFAVGNTNDFPVNYDLTVSIATTNYVGDLYSVLQGMDDLIGPYYRYESGTSMSAAEVSGVLALIQDYFTHKLTLTPSPALLKAMLINGARTTGSYSYAITNGLNFEGWGLVNIANSLPFTTNSFVNGSSAPIFFADQSPTNALATGDSHTYLLTLNTNSDAPFLPLQATLVWTDPCGDPAAAIKLVNNLDLIITNLDTGEVYYGNDISTDVGYNLPADTNGPPNLDTINNVENIILPPLLAGNYSITVVGRLVNVNAVTAQTNNVVQDYALVIACGEGEVQDALTVTPVSVASNPTGDQNITYVTVTNSPLFHQFVGANTPLLGTNIEPLGANTIWGTNGQVTLGMTNQWHFYVVTNTGPNANFTNAAFITFNASTLSLPRMGVYSDTVANATRPEADIDMYVSQDSSLTNLNPAVIADCLAGANNSRSSLTQGGTEFTFFTNSAPGQVYYVGIKSEDQMASEYAFLAVFTDKPFSLLDQNGNQIVNGLLLPVNIPDGNNAHPGVANVFALSIIPMQVGKVTVTNLNEHQNFGDLFGTLSFGGTSVVLNSHDGLGNTFGTLPFVYDDSRNLAIGATNTDGPGKLTNFRSKSALGPWILTELDNAQTQTGQVIQLTLVIQPHRNLTDGAVTVTIPPGGWFIDFVDVPVGYTNLTFAATNLDVPPIQPPLQMFEKLGVEPTLTDFDQEADLTNCVTGTYPTGTLPGNTISVGPPLNAGQYFIGIYNPNTVQSATVLLSATLGIGANAADTYVYTTNSSTPLLDDAVSPSTLFVAATNPIASVNVGMVVNSPRISDLTFTLVSPTGQRVLLMENRGGLSTNGAGNLFLTTNSFAPVSANGGGLPQTNYLNVGQTSGRLLIKWDFFTVPDQMTVYYGTNSGTFGTNNPGSTLIFDTGMFSGAGSTNLAYGPGTSTYLTIIMNEFGNTNGANGTRWTYTAGGVETNFNYLVFTDDTNLATVPIKFAIPPYTYANSGTNYALSDFDLATNGNYLASTNIYDAFGGWSLTNMVLAGTNLVAISNNLVSVVTDPSVAADGSNYLALANGSIFRQIPMTPGRQFSLSFQYRGPGISGWWRGEGDATDSSDPEVNGNNGELIGRFNFPVGEVGQSFAMEDAGSQFRFAGTNTYVQIHQPPFPISVVAGAESNGLVTVLSSALDVGTGGGFTVEGWINPTNISFQQPLVEWLARTPTNLAGTNVVILAGPFLNPATSHYYYLLGATNWTNSELWATEIGGHLATIDTANEQNWVFDNFANYGGTNRNLWIGLTNNLPATFAWSSGLTNVVYTNWFGGQPTNCDGQHNYTFMFGATNAQPGLWTLANNAGAICPATVTTNKIYGVVEVADLQPNGVQFWVSVTNAPGTTNQVALTNGCLFANLVDTTNGSHYIYSAPGLVQGNVFQHVALTYDTNSGLASLYYNGTNVATTNLGYLIPKTTGDVLLGKDMSRATNNYFGGRMDEMSIYARSLSAAEISAIYRVSTTATNGLAGKFDPSVTPAFGLAEAGVSFGGRTNFLLGANKTWQTLNFSFKVTTNSLPLQITGLQPGMLLDSFNVSEQPLANLYYLPEQALSALVGSSAHGEWTLQIWDNRVGAAVSNQLVSWQLNFVLESNALFAASLEPQVPTPSTVGPGQTVYYQVNVPSWAKFATNILVSSTSPVDLIFNPTNVPSGSGPSDIILLTGQTSAAAVPPIAVNLAPPFVGRQAGSTYYLAVRNSGIHAAAVVLEVDYDITALTNGVPFTSILTNTAADAVRYFSYDVSSNAFEATFQLLNLSSNADLVLRKGPPLPTLINSDYGSFSTVNADETIYVLTNSTPVPLSGGHWYLGVFRRDSGPVNYTVLAKEVDQTNLPPTIIELTNGVPVNFTAGPGAALTNFFHFAVTNMILNGVTNNGLRFEVYNLSGNGNLTVQTNALPSAAPFFQSSQNPGQSPEIVIVHTNSTLTNLVADWYLGVPNQTPNLINFTIVASIETNAYFPAFPGATGSGGGAVGGRFGTVYHVTSLADSGPGTLRDAVSVTNRTVIFDVSGTINLATPLVVTNSFLTIAGQTAPGGGITVAGQMTTVQSATDVVIRNVRFRPVSTGLNLATIWSNGFENLVGPQGNRAAGAYFCGGWHVDAGSIDVGAIANAPAYDGINFVDLSGTSAGTISTNVSTVPGQSYTLTFAYSQNPDGVVSGFPIASANVLQNGNPLLSLAVGLTNTVWANLKWATTSVVFTATAPLTQIQFVSQSFSAYGMLLDGVSLATTNTATVAGSGDSLRLTNVANVAVDHVSASWSLNNLVSVLNSSNVTVQWSILADSFYTTNLSATGSLLRYGSGALSFNHNLYADNYSGSPRLGDNLSLDFVNNVIYNWGLFPGLTGGTNDLIASPGGSTNQLNYACNYLIAGPDTARFGTNYAITNIAYFGGTTNALAANWIFQTNNFIDSNTNRILDGANTQWAMFTNNYTRFEQPFPLIPVPTDEAFLAYERVLAFAGVNMSLRDSVDTNIVAKVRNQTGTLISTSGALPVLNSTFPYLDTDQDGIPNFWETTFGESVTNANNNLDRDGDGYTDLEEYNNWLAAPHALTVTNTPVGVDLMQLFGKTGNLSFAVTNGINGTVYLTNVLNYTNSLGVAISVTNTGPFSNSIAIFTPTNTTPAFSGYASFGVYATNNSTIAYFGPTPVSVVVSAVPILYANNTNTPPTFPTNAAASVTNNELSLLTVTNTATASSTNLTLSYTVSMIIDTNAMNLLGWPLTFVTTTPSPVISANGIITWTPSEAQGPGVYIISTVATDNGIPVLSATNSFSVTIYETNAAPFWATNVPSQTNYTIAALNQLVVTNTASDSDLPVNPLTYQLIGPAGATITTNGIIMWTPGIGQLGLFTFTTIVTDTNIYALANQSLSATNTFTVFVTGIAGPFVFTEPAQAVSGASAQLNGMVTPNGIPTTTWFEWGTTTNYGTVTPSVGVGGSYNVVYTTNVISGLTTNVAYHFRVVAANAVGTNYGFDQILDEANVVAWGADYVGQINVPAGLSNVVAVAAAYDHSLALKNNRTVVAWGDNTFGQATVPANITNALAVAGGQYYSMALNGGGTVTAWGANILNQISVPAGLSNVVTIAGGTYSSLALKNSGAIVAWGASFFGLTNVPPNATNMVAVAGGGFHNLGIKNDGTVIAWGDNSASQTLVPAGLSNVVAIAGGNYHSLALRNDGTVVAWGDNGSGQTNVPAGLSNVVAIAAGGFHSLALKSDGSLVTWGDNSSGQTSVPVNLTNAVAISGGYFHNLALTPQSLASLTNPIVVVATNGVTQTNTISGNSVIYYQVNVPVNVDLATNSLLFALNGPLNVWFTTNVPPTVAGPNDSLLLGGATNGVSILSTTSAPTNIVPGATYYLGVQNTNNFSVNCAVQVDFHFTTPPPVNVSGIVYTNIGGFPGFLLTWFAPSNALFQVQFTTNLVPANWITFTNIISYNTNAFTNPTNTQFNFFDDGVQYPFGPSRFYRLILLGSGTVSNTPPVFSGTPANRVINPLGSLVITNTATDAEAPPQSLSYTLSTTATGTNLPTINTNTGVIVWTPDVSQAGSTNVFTTIVADNGTPSLSATNSFSVVVNPLPIISSITYSNGFLLKWLAPTNDIFEVQVATNLISPVWLTLATNVTYLGPVTPTNGWFSYLDNGSSVPFGPFRFYRLNLTGVTAPALPVVPPILISSIVSTNNGFLLTWFAPTNDQFNVRWATNLAVPVAWFPFANTNAITSANGTFTFLDTNAPMLMKFYELILLP